MRTRKVWGIFALLVFSAGCQPASPLVWEGDLQIPGPAAASTLRRLVAVEGNLIVFGTNLEALDLPALRTVSGDVVIKGNSRLKTLSGLERLVWIGGRLIVERNSSMVHLAGLDALASIGGSLHIHQNVAMESLDGLDGLVAVGRTLGLTENPLLGSLGALRNLQSIGHGVELRWLDKLRSLEGLAPRSMRGEVDLAHCPGIPVGEVEAWLQDRRELGWLPPSSQGPMGLPNAGEKSGSRGTVSLGRGQENLPFPVTWKLAQVRGEVGIEGVQQILLRHRNQVRFCYERELARAQGLQERGSSNLIEDLREGSITMGWTIDGEGRATESRVDQDTFPEGNVARCIQWRISRWRFPESAHGSETTVVINWKFQDSRGQKENR